MKASAWARPRVGQVVTYTCESLSALRALPVNPIVLRIRQDLNWGSVMHDYLSGTTDGSIVENDEMSRPPSLRKPFGYWTTQQNIRNFFEDAAKTTLLFDPLLAANWYAIDRNAILRIKVSISLVSYTHF